MTDTYILDGHTAVLCEDTAAWSRFYSDNDKRRVANTELGAARISTVFLALDHNFHRGPPVLFESLVFWDGHPLDEKCERYETWEQAEAGHAAMVERVKAAQREGE